MVYQLYAVYYPLLAQDIDYASIGNYLQKIIKLHQPQAQTAYDFGCGLGTITAALSKKIKRISGFDIAVEMLNYAHRTYPHLDFQKMDLTELVCLPPVEVITALGDVINHIVTHEELIQFINNVWANLSPNGLFIFDINTPYELKYRMAVESEDKIDGIKIIWQGNYNSSNKIARFDITFYDQNKLLGKECLLEKIYTKQELLGILKKYFQIINIYGDYSFNTPNFDDERYVFLCRKKQAAI